MTYGFYKIGKGIREQKYVCEFPSLLVVVTEDDGRCKQWKDDGESSVQSRDETTGDDGGG